MKHNPKISVIVPVYNVEKYLRKCVDSILSQTFTDFELLLIDDGSKDHSGEICDEYALQDDRVKVFHKENGGVSSARNLGIDVAKGEWITFVDADDWVSEKYFPENMLMCNTDLILNQLAKKEYSDAVGNTEVVASKFLANILNEQISLGPWAKFFRRAIINECGLRYYEDIKFAEDAIFNLQYFKYVRNLSVYIKGIYHYVAPPASTMWHKYGMTFEMLESYSDKMLTAYFDLKIKNKGMERSMFFSFVVFANLLCHDRLEYKRKRSFICNVKFQRLRKNILNDFGGFRWLYYSNRYLPYWIDKLVSTRCLTKWINN